MTEDEYRDDWLNRFGKSLDDGDVVARLKLFREARSQPNMLACLDAVEFMLVRLDGSEAARKAAMDIAIKSKAIVNISADKIEVSSGATVGVDNSLHKNLGNPDA